MFLTKKKDKIRYNEQILTRCQEYIIHNPKHFDPEYVLTDETGDFAGIILRLYFDKTFKDLRSVFSDSECLAVASRVLQLRFTECETLFYVDAWPDEYRARWQRIRHNDYVAKGFLASDLIFDFKARIIG